MRAISVLPSCLLLGLCVAKENDLSLFVSCRTDLTGRYYLIGYTASGTPYYGSDRGFYLFHDPSCDGTEDRAARWVLDVDAPSTEAWEDLDGDGKCAYQARLDGANASAPPTSEWWTVFCDGRWQEAQVTISEDKGNHYHQECYQAGECRDRGTLPCQWCGLHQGQQMFCCSNLDEYPEGHNCFGTADANSSSSIDFRCVTTTTSTVAPDRYLNNCGADCQEGLLCAWCGLHQQLEMFCCHSEKQYLIDQACHQVDWSEGGVTPGQLLCVPQMPEQMALPQQSTSSGVLVASVLSAAIVLVMLVAGISFLLRRSTRRQEEELQARNKARKAEKAERKSATTSDLSGRDLETGPAPFSSVPAIEADGFKCSL